MRTSAIAVSLVILLASVACSGPAQPGTPSDQQSSAHWTGPKRITAAITVNPPSLYGGVTLSGSKGNTGSLQDLVSAGLSIADSQDRLRPELAEEVPTLANGRWKLLSDGRMETSWTIRPQARWHDGAPFSAEDLAFTSMVKQDKDLPELSDPPFALVQALDVSDPRTVTVTWGKTYIYADSLFDNPLLPRHLLEHPYATDKSGFTELSYWTDGFVGNGQYRLREWVKGSHLILEAFEFYALGRPKIDEIEVRFIVDQGALTANILAGAIDMTLGVTLSLDQALQLRDQWREGQVRIVPDAWLAIFPQLLDPNPAVVADVRFRRALLNAIDRQEMVDTVMAGQSSVAHSYVNPGDPTYKEVEPNIARYDYDPRRAAQMLEDLGYQKGADGILRDAANQVLRMEFRTTAALDIQVKAFFPVVDYWQRVGIPIEPVVVPPQRDRDRPYRATFPTFELLRNPIDPSRLVQYHSSQARVPENNYAGNNYSRYRNPEWDALVDTYFTTIPLDERTQVMGRIVHHMTDQLIVMSLFYDTFTMMVSNRVMGNITSRTVNSSEVWNVQEWDVK